MISEPSYLASVHLCIVCLGMYARMQEPTVARGVGSPGAEVAGSAELLTWVPGTKFSLLPE